MNFFGTIAAYLRQHFGKDIAAVEEDLRKADTYLTEHAAAAEHLASVLVDALRLIAPPAGSVAQAVVADAEQVLAEFQALVKKYADITE